MKSLIRKLIPRPLLERYWERQKQTPEAVFTDIYANNRWGGASGEFFSGSGSTDEPIVSGYVDMITREGGAEGFLGLRFVDFGCGDFRVGARLLPYCSSYTGIDVVKPLIQRNQETHGNATTRFLHLDIIREELPDGDVCLIRQVLQHLSNAQISAVLPKLRKYRWLLITEHYPEEGPAVRPNKDKIHGAGVRVANNSGVSLSQPPFSLPAEALRMVLEVPGTFPAEGVPPGVIRTFLYKPPR